MGEEIRRKGKQTIGTDETRTTEPSSNSASTTSTSGRATNGRATNGRATSGEEENVVSKLVILETETEEQRKAREEQEKRDRRNAQKRESAAKRRAEKAQEKNKSAKAPAVKMDYRQISALLVGVFDMVASRPNCEHWKLDAKEADQIAKPLAEILAEYEVIGQVAGKYANHIALVMACVTIIIPRAMITIAMQNKHSERVNNNVTIIPKSAGRPANDGAIREGSTGDHTNHAPTSTDVNPSIFDVIPSISTF